MGSALGQITMIKESYSVTQKNEIDLLREKYMDAGIMALNYIYESGAIEAYEKYQKGQEAGNVLTGYTAPNGLSYELDDIKSLESLGIYDREEQILQLNTLGKYTIKEDWSSRLPNLLLMDSNSMRDLRYVDEKYKFVMSDRKARFKDIKSTMFDQVQLYIYKKSIDDYTEWNNKNQVALASYYYLSPTKNIRRYINVFRVEGLNLIEYPDWSHIEEFNQDMGTSYSY